MSVQRGSAFQPRSHRLFPLPLAALSPVFPSAFQPVFPSACRSLTTAAALAEHVALPLAETVRSAEPRPPTTALTEGLLDAWGGGSPVAADSSSGSGIPRDQAGEGLRNAHHDQKRSS